MYDCQRFCQEGGSGQIGKGKLRVVPILKINSTILLTTRLLFEASDLDNGGSNSLFHSRLLDGQLFQLLAVIFILTG